MVAAGSVVPPGMQVPPQSLVMGLPGKVVRQVTQQDRDLVLRTAKHYVEYSRAYQQAYPAAKSQLPAGSAGTDVARLLRGLAVFDGLNEPELARVAGICRTVTYRQGQVITQQNADDSDLFVVRDGLLEVSVGEGGQGELPPHTVVHLGEGQVVGEIALIDHGPRSATVRCVSAACRLIVIERDDFEALCAAAHHIGLVVYRNLAADLSFKLRHRHLAQR